MTNNISQPTAMSLRCINAGVAIATLALIAGCNITDTTAPTITSTPDVDQSYQKLACISVPADLRWMYSDLFDSNGHLKSLNDIQSTPPDQALGPSPGSDIIVVYEILTDRYRHPPACGERYPTGSAGLLNENALNHKTLSCTEIPSDLKQHHPNLFDSNGRLKNWKAIETAPFSRTSGNLDDEVTTLYNEVVGRLGHPISCPNG